MPGIVVAASAGVAATIYLVFRSAYYFPDPMRWELAIAKFGAPAVWHPHRLIYNPLALAFRDLLGLFGYDGRLFGAMQIMSALWGAAGVVLCYSALRRAGASRPWAGAGSFALAFSYGYWAYACNAECVIVSTVAAIGTLRAAQWAWGGSGLGRWAACAAVAGAAALVHISNVLLFVFLVAAFFLAKPEKAGRKFPLLVLSYFIPPVVAYAVVAFGVLRMGGAAEAGRWFFGVAGRSEYYTTYRLYNVALDLYALTRNLFGLRWAKDVIGGGWTANYVALAVFLGLSASALAAAVVGAAARFFKKGSARRQAWLALALFLPYAVFFTFRDAGGFDRWTVQAFALLFFVYASVGASAPRRFGRIVLGALPVLFFVGNFWGSIYPESRPENNEHLAFARFVDGITEPGDVVVFSGVDGVGPGVYTEYFAAVEAAGIYFGVRDADAFRRRIDGKIAAGRAAYVGDARPTVMTKDLISPGSREKYRVTGELASELLAPYKREYVATYRGRRYEPSDFWRLLPAE